MKRKRMLALMLTAALTMSSAMVVMADLGDSEDDASGTSTTVTGEGEVNYVNETILSVTLPTTATMQLTIDPQGLSALENGKTASKEDLAAAAGLITGNTKAAVVNNSSVPVKVSVKLTGLGDATFVTKTDDVEKDSGENVLLYALPSADEVNGTLAEAAEAYAASTTGILITENAVEVDFVLPAAAYVYSKNADGTTTEYKQKDGDKGHGTAIAFEGLVNKKANWSDYAGGTKTISMTAVFDYEAAAETDEADTTNGMPYGIMTPASGTTITVAQKDKAPSAQKTAAFNTTSGATFKVDFGAGDLAATKVSGIQWSKDGTTYKLLGTSSWTASEDGKEITIKGTYTGFDASGNGYLKVAFDKGEAVVVTLQK